MAIHRSKHIYNRRKRPTGITVVVPIMRSWQPISLLVLLALMLLCWPAMAEEPKNSPQACEKLAGHDFSQVMDAPTEITQATLVLDNMGRQRPFCHVAGHVEPNVGFELMLPVSGWNGKFLHIGCAGWCGSTAFVIPGCFRYGNYACVGTDMGHTGKGGLWFRGNLQGQIDFSYRATHVVTVAGKAIAESFYGTPANRSYFAGCSTGGYQAMVEAQRYPYDFDGIVAGAPDMDESDLAVRGLWLKRNFFAADGKPVLSASDLLLLHNAVLSACDMDDGVKDGLVGDPVHCGFDPAQLQCKTGNRDSCLTPNQVQAIKNIYGAARTSKGPILSSKGMLPGSELSWAKSFQDTWGDSYFKDTGILSATGKVWSAADFDFDRDFPRSGTGVLFPDTNPDLRKFKAAGGKLLSYQGDNDTLEIPGAIFDYYETVERTMGGRAATQDFYRLFTVPGMGHCTGGDGAYTIDYLSYLEAWVEQGKAPDKMIGVQVDPAYLSSLLLKLPKEQQNAIPAEAKVRAGAQYLRFPLDSSVPVKFSRPVYPYPFFAKYSGHGSSTDAANFRQAGGPGK
ncbi:MAG TPA: tannase/feruloyl esterase family alpha/beta hydrolase [Rhizomicrobium sp.]|nr:tannase/feruloyl esterase family alpha/beta hydrolase [Rhizomicrobium sp.]